MPEATCEEVGGLTAPEADPFGSGGAGDDPPPYTPPLEGFWDSQPCESNVPLGQGPPAYEPPTQELGPD